MVSDQKLSRLHFASAAAWWKPTPFCDHARAPASPTDFENWTQRSINYLKAKLERLQRS
jgi:hypothetical protein